MKGLARLSVNVLLLTCVCQLHGNLNGNVTVSPRGVAFVCVGDQLELTCTTLGRYLQWIFLVTEENKAMATKYCQTVTTDSEQVQPLYVNSTKFTFLRSSGAGNLPLISRLLISHTMYNLNGTEIMCEDQESEDSSSVVLHIVNETNLLLQDTQDLNVTVISQVLFQSTSVTAILQWTQNFMNLRNVSVSPQAKVKQVGNTTFEIIMEYNTPINVSVEFQLPCEQDSMVKSIQLHYTNCGDPSATITDLSVVVDGYNTDPVFERTRVTFSCPPGLTLVGFNSTICKENGEWESDLGELKCISSADTEVVTGIIVGSVLLAAMIMIFVLILVIARNTTVIGSISHKRKYRTEEESGDIKSTKHIGAKDLVYAEVSHTAFSQQMKTVTFVDLEDPTMYAQINTGTLGGEVSGMQSAQLQQSDDINEDIAKINLDNLLIQLKTHVTDKWYLLGEALGIEKEVLDKYAQKCSPEDCIVETLDYWLRNHPDEPTWKEVAQALKTIDLPQMDHHIERIYKTGKLPVEVHIDSIPQLQETAHADVTTEVLESRCSKFIANNC